MKKTPFYMRVPRNVGKHDELIAQRHAAYVMKAVTGGMAACVEAVGRNVAASAGGGQYAMRVRGCNLQQHVSASVCDTWTGESKAGLKGCSMRKAAF
jgi:hypothetical protein